MLRFLFVLLLFAGGLYPLEEGSKVYGQAPLGRGITAGSPQEVKAKTGRLAVLQSKATGEVAWVWDRRYLPDDQVYQDTARKALVVTSGAPAAFFLSSVEFQVGKGFVQVDWLVTFEGAPVPPGPLPPPPDTFQTRLQRAYLTDKAAGKVKVDELKLLGSIYANLAAYIDLAPNTTVMYQILDLTVTKAVTAGDLPAVLPVIRARLIEVAGPDKALTAELKAQFRLAFAEVAKAIESLLGPLPPTPDPIPPSPSPLPIAGLHVLIVYESTALTPAQNQIISGAEVRGYVTGKGGQFRAYDQNTQLVKESQWVQDAFKRERKSVPWLLISNHPKGGYEGPLPTTVQEVVNLLKKYGE